MEAKIISTGSYLPSTSVPNQQLETLMDTNDEWIKSRTGIEARHLSETENTSVLCGKAAIKMLDKANVSALEVDLIIVATMTPDYQTPSTACLVQEYIGAKQVMAFDINAACSGFVYALSIAEKMVQSGNFRYALVLGGEVMSKVIDWEDRSTAVLFGDGAGGVLLKGVNEKKSFLAEDIHADGSRGLSLTARPLTTQDPFSKTTDEIQQTGYLKMDGRAIFDFSIRNVPASIRQLAEIGETQLAEVDYYLLHQANYRIVEAIAKKLKLPMSKFKTNMQHYGNTSAASIPILLDEVVSSGELKLGSGQKIVLTGFGGGLTWASILIEL